MRALAAAAVVAVAALAGSPEAGETTGLERRHRPRHRPRGAGPAGVAATKITGEEERYPTPTSRTSTPTWRARASRSSCSGPLRTTGHAALATTIAERFASVEDALDRYRRPTLFGYAVYDELTPADRRTPVQRIDARAEPLSSSPAIVNGG